MRYAVFEVKNLRGKKWGSVIILTTNNANDTNVFKNDLVIRVFQAISDPAACHAVVAKREGGSGDEIPLSLRGDCHSLRSLPNLRFSPTTLCFISWLKKLYALLDCNFYKSQDCI